MAAPPALTEPFSCPLEALQAGEVPPVNPCLTQCGHPGASALAAGKTQPWGSGWQQGKKEQQRPRNTPGSGSEWLGLCHRAMAAVQPLQQLGTGRGVCASHPVSPPCFLEPL